MELLAVGVIVVAAWFLFMGVLIAFCRAAKSADEAIELEPRAAAHDESVPGLSSLPQGRIFSV